jgi:predicted nucleic acid-binding protein
MNLLVIDSSVFNKLYLDEPDSRLAVELFDKARLGEYQLIAPDLLYLEVISTANYYRLPIQPIVELLMFQTQHLLQLCTPTATELKKAVETTLYYE